ncbi:MAG: DinB family protein [Planctomycetota bacterium]|nr:DinB family protein [Planctomycetota bacterium]
MDISALQRLHEWRIWMDGRLIAAATPLGPEQLSRPFEIGQGTLIKTLEHMGKADEIWLTRLTRRPEAQLAEMPPRETVAAVGAAWDAANAGWREYLARLDAAELKRTLRGKSGAGLPFEMPVLDVVLHVAVHASYTAAQANNILRHLGAKVEDVNLAPFSRQSRLQG